MALTGELEELYRELEELQYELEAAATPRRAREVQLLIEDCQQRIASAESDE